MARHLLSGRQTFIQNAISETATVSYEVPPGCAGSLDGFLVTSFAADGSSDGECTLLLNDVTLDYVSNVGQVVPSIGILLDLPAGPPLTSGDVLTVDVGSTGVTFGVILWGTLGGGGTF